MGDLYKTNSALKIDEDYLDLVPRPTEDERKSLKFSIQDEGQQLPIVANQKRIILDGHTRAMICEELKIKPKYIIKKFPNKFEERKFVILSNIARRHLSKFQKIDLAWEIYEVEKKKAYDRMASWGGDWQNDNFCKTYGMYPKEGTAAQIFAKYVGVGKHTIEWMAYIKKNGNKKLIKQLIAGEITISRAYTLLRGLAYIPHLKKKPSVLPKECPECLYKTRKAKIKSRKCHVHRWICCTNCKWGL